jgi:hypothetical protein
MHIIDQTSKNDCDAIQIAKNGSAVCWSRYNMELGGAGYQGDGDAQTEFQRWSFANARSMYT